jgi:hypothetical protein
MVSDMGSTSPYAAFNLNPEALLQQVWGNAVNP